MKLIKSVKNKIELVWDAICDNKKRIHYEILIDNIDSTRVSYHDVVIINDFIGYPDARLKKIMSYEYHCTRELIKRLISSVSGNVIMVLSNHDSDINELNRLLDYYSPHCAAILITNNVGQDIGAYASGIDFCIKKCVAAKYVTLLNTSQFYDYRLLNAFITNDIPDNSILGLSFGIGPRFLLLKSTHIQSFAIKTSFKSIVLIFDKVVHNLCFYNSKYFLIYFGEVRISKIAFKIGLTPYIFNGSFNERVKLRHSFMHYDHREAILKNLSKTNH